MSRPDPKWDPEAVPALTIAPGAAPNLIDAIEAEFTRYLVTAPGVPLVLAVWSVATHVYQQFKTFPYLGITSPLPECGKTTVLDVLELFSARPKRRFSVTPASLFRCIERDQPTLLIDEQQLIGEKSNQALKELLDQGYKRGGQVERSGASGGVFAVYCPKAIALIGQLPPTLATRCIPVYMDPLGPDDVVDAYIPQPGEDRIQSLLHDACLEWANIERDRAHDAYMACLRGGGMGFRGRAAEIWLPLLAVCEIAAPNRLSNLIDVANRLLAVRRDAYDQNGGIRLLADIRDILDRFHGAEKIRSEVLAQELRRIEDWSALTAKLLADHLGKYRIYPTRIRLGPDTYRGYHIASFQRIFKLYLPARPERVRTAGASV